MLFGREVGVGLRSPPLRGTAPNFRPLSIVAKRLDRLRWPLGMEVGLGSGDFVFDGDPATSRKKCTPTPTQFLAHVYCGQMAGWMNTPLGMEVDLGTGHIVDGVPAPCVRGTAAPLFSPMSVVAMVPHLSYC